MYYRTKNTAHIKWEPEDEQNAIQAMKDVDGTGVPDTHTLPDDAPIRLTDEKTTAVRERYDELVSKS